MTNTYFPMWLNATLFVLSAVLAYVGSQTSIQFEGVAALVIGVAQVVVAALLAFQRATQNTLRRLQGRPTIA